MGAGLQQVRRNPGGRVALMSASGVIARAPVVWIRPDRQPAEQETLNGVMRRSGCARLLRCGIGRQTLQAPIRALSTLAAKLGYDIPDRKRYVPSGHTPGEPRRA